MKLIQELEHIASHSESLFARQLSKEDVARLRKALELAEATPSLAAYHKDAMMIGWTPGDLMTHELVDVLEPLLAAIHGYAQDAQNPAHEKAVSTAWLAFDTARRQRLLRCT